MLAIRIAVLCSILAIPPAGAWAAGTTKPGDVYITRAQVVGNGPMKHRVDTKLELIIGDIIYVAEPKRDCRLHLESLGNLVRARLEEEEEDKPKVAIKMRITMKAQIAGDGEPVCHGKGTGCVAIVEAYPK